MVPSRFKRGWNIFKYACFCMIDIATSAMKGLPKIEGTDELFVPGEPEERVLKERLKTGIPLPAATREKLSEVAKKYEVKVPWEDR